MLSTSKLLVVAIISSAFLLLANYDGQRAVTAFTLPNKSPSVAFVDDRLHTRQLYYQDDRWRLNDLTEAAHAPEAQPGTSLTNFVLHDGMPSVAFTDAKRHLYQLFYQNHQWRANDLTAASGGPATLSKTPLTSFVLPDGMPSITSFDDKQHVIQFYYQNHIWQANDLTALTKAPASARNSALTSFVSSNGLPNLVYEDERRHIEQLFYMDHHWSANDLTIAAHLHLTMPGSGLCSFVLADGMPSVVYVNDADHVIQVFYQESKWQMNDLTKASQAPMAGHSSALSSLVISQQSPSVFFVDKSGHVDQLFFQDHRWQVNDLTVNAHGPLPVITSGLSSFTQSDGLPSVVYVDQRQHINVLSYKDNNWHVKDLSAGLT